ncbi:interleukin-1 beta isoform X1 [Synchiropus splendidus]|uniref:interleukin-1 beta isoform X1 n=2 Tax=Synchiropus splendidus TaxID=270530 RepID=UPI00237E5751|nr:interleukin-1 beta isoform X1 [Synchiropus splendidus]
MPPFLQAKKQTKMEFSMKRSLSDQWRPHLPEGLDLELISHPHSLRSVVNLVIAVGRLKNGESEPVLSTAFTDENLLDIMLDSIVEEQVVFELMSAPPAPFLKNDEFQCSVTDTQKRSLILVENSMELHSVLLQGGNESRKVCLNMSTYIHPAPSTNARTVALGIKNTSLYLTCKQEDGKPKLHLEEVADKSVLSNIVPGSDMMRFLFHRTDAGRSVSTLMSAQYPNWYISTAEEDHQPVALSLENVDRYTTFHIHRQS